MKKSLLNKVGRTCFNLALSTSSLSAIGAAQSYYRTRNGNYNNNKQFISDMNSTRFSSANFSTDVPVLTQKFNKGTLQDIITDVYVEKGRQFTELLLVDQDVQNKSVFLSQQQPGLKVIEIGKGGIKELTKILSRYEGLDAVHLVTHAKPGAIQIGGELIDTKMFQEHLATFASLNKAIKEGGDLLLYGCELAKGADGEDFLEIIKNNTHIDVAASDDLTGNATYQGDWDLEIQKGDIEAQPLEDSIALNDFTGVLQYSGTIGDYLGGTSTGYIANSGYTGPDYIAQWNLNGSTFEVDLEDTTGSYTPVFYYEGSQWGYGNNFTNANGGFTDNTAFQVNNINFFQLDLNPGVDMSFAVEITTDRGGRIVHTLTNGGLNPNNIDLSSLPKNITRFYLRPIRISTPNTPELFDIEMTSGGGLDLTYPSPLDASSILQHVGDLADGQANVKDITVADLGIVTPALTDVEATCIAAYNTYIKNNPGLFSAPATQPEIQAMLTTVNSTCILDQIGLEGDNPDTINSVVTATQLGYILPALTGIVAGNETAYQDYIDANPNSFASPATQAEVQAMITAVNLLAAIGTDANDGAGTGGNSIPGTAAELNALPNVSGAVDANLAAYQVYVDNNVGSFSSPATEAEIQTMITAVNTQQSLLAAIGTDANDGAGTGGTSIPGTAAELNALPNVSGAVDGNLAAYQDYVDNNVGSFSSPATEAEIQTMITAVNTQQSLLAAIGTDANDGAGTGGNSIPGTAAELNALPNVSGAVDANLAAYQDYVDNNVGSFSSPATEAEIQTMITAVNTQQSLLAAIGTDANDGAGTGGNSIPGTAAELNALPNVSGAIDANLAAYQTYVDNNVGSFSSPASVAEVQTMITAVNAQQSLLAAIGTDANDGAGTGGNSIPGTAAELNALPNVSGAVDGNLAAYQTYVDNNVGSFSSPATEAEIQTMITAVNAQQSLLAAIGTDANDGAGTGGNSIPGTAAELNALPNVSGAVDANLAAYQTYVDNNVGSFSSPATEAEVQTMITAVNTQQSLLAAIGTDANDGAGTGGNSIPGTAAELNALPNVSGAVDANLAAYQTYIDNNVGSFSSPATEVEVQTMITAVNAQQSLLAAIGTDANDGAGTGGNSIPGTAAELNALPNVSGAVDANLAAYQTYVDNNIGSFSSPATEAEVQTMITAVNAQQSLLAAIGTDANDGAGAGGNSIPGTAAELNALPNVSGAVDGNLAAYQDYVDNNVGSFSSPATEAEIQTMITAVNTQQSLLAAIGTDANDGAGTGGNSIPGTAAELNALPNVSGAVDANLAAYQTYVDNNVGSFSSPATEAEVQTMITAVNTQQSLLAAIGTDANDGAGTGGNSIPGTAAELNALPNVSGAVDGNLAAYQDYVDNNVGSFSSPATEAEIQTMITAVNTQQSLLAAIGTDANDGAGTGGNSIPGTAAELNALPNVSGAVDANLAAYQTYVDNNVGSFSSPATEAEVQTMITAVNTQQSLLAAIGTDANDGAGTGGNSIPGTAAELNALPNVSGAVDGNLAAYQTYVDNNVGSFSSPATEAEIQTMITAVNTQQSLLAAIGTDANDGAGTGGNSIPGTAAELNALPNVSGSIDANLAAYQTYVDNNVGSFSSPATEAEVQTMVTAVNAQQSLLAAIGTDANDGAGTGGNSIPGTAAELNALPNVSGAVDANLAAYQTYVDNNVGSFSSPATEAEIQTMVTAVNASQTILAQIGLEGDDPDAVNSVVTVAQLNMIVPALTGVIAGNEMAYQDYIDVNPNDFSSPATQVEVQAMITTVNGANGSDDVLAQIGLEGDDPDAVNSVVTVAQLNMIVPALTGVVAANEMAYQDYIDANPNDFSSPATQAEVQAMIDTVNNTSNALLLEILEDSTSPGGSNNANGTSITAEQLGSISGVTGVDLGNEAAYQAAIEQETGFSNPPTVAEVQEIIDTVNQVVIIVNNANDPADGNPSFTDLENVGITNLNSNLLDAYEETIANSDPKPRTLQELQELINAVNANPPVIRVNVEQGFSPNGDGINDAWVILGIESFPNNSVKVFNRWGAEVFSARGYQNTWTGESNGKRVLSSGDRLPTGAYYYVIDLGDNETAPSTGWIYINY